MTRSKEVILSSGNKLVNFLDSSSIGLKKIAFKEISWILKLAKNEVTLDIT